jgi:hypothetical protein
MKEANPEQTIPSRIIAKASWSSILAQKAQAAMLVAVGIMGMEELRELLGRSVSSPVGTLFLKSMIVTFVGDGLLL